MKLTIRNYKLFTSRSPLFWVALSLTLGIFILALACNKTATTPTYSAATDPSYATDQLMAEKAYSDAETICDQAYSVITSSGTMGYRTTATTVGPCATVTHSGDSIIINFGTTDCMCLDGRTRRGEIIVTSYGGGYADSGTIDSITFLNYYVNGNLVTGIKKVQNMGKNPSGQPYYDITLIGCAVTQPSGVVTTFNSTRTRTWLTGYNTTTLTDDTYSLSGNGAMLVATNSGGTITSFDVYISVNTPLIEAYGCRWIEAGTIDYTLESTGAISAINFGTTPVCDSTATLTGSAVGTVSFTMP